MSRLHDSFALGLAVVMFSPAATAQIPVSGYVKLYHHNRWEGTDAITRTGTRLQLTVGKTLGDRAAFFGSMDFDVDEIQHGSEKWDYWQNFLARRGVNLDVYPVEMYVDLYWPWMDLRLGKQFIFWGKTEWINPTDNINPWDYANISAEIEDYRLAVDAVKAAIYIGSATLESVIVPVFTPHRMPLMPVFRTAPGYGPPLYGGYEPRLPEQRLKNAQVAFRFLYNFAGVDWSLSYYRGHEHTPATTIVPHLSKPGQSFLEVLPVYPRVQIFGGDFQKVFGHWGIRGEGAYFLTDDRDGKDPWLPNPHIQGVLALDYSPSDELSLVLQSVEERKFKYDPAYEAAARMRWHIAWIPEPRQRTSFSTRLHWQPGDYWTTQLIGVWNRDTKDRFVLAFLNYQPADALNVTVGGVFFGGQPQTPFGRMADQDRLFLEVKASF